MWIRSTIAGLFLLSIPSLVCAEEQRAVVPVAFDVTTQSLSDQQIRQGEDNPTAPPWPEASEAELAKKLSNPVSSLISVPLQSNFDFEAGQSNNKFKYTLNVQPVIPVSLNKDWTLITRVIAPLIYQEPLFLGQGYNFGLGDINPTFFFTPTQTFNGWIIGAGPVFLIPTGTDTALGTGKWSIGPSVVALQQKGPWTYGILTNHLWSFAGDSDRSSVNQTFLQPFLAYNSKTGFGVTLQTESSYNWTTSQWTIPVGIFASQVLKIGGQPLSLSAGPRIYADGPSGAPKWGFRVTLTLLFPQ